jgi:hypothetical protein
MERTFLKEVRYDVGRATSKETYRKLASLPGYLLGPAGTLKATVA